MTAEEPTDLHAQTLAVCLQFERCGIPYAIGGALARNYFSEPRMTHDIDLNVFLSETEAAPVFDCIRELGIDVPESAVRESLSAGQVRLRWAGHLLDLFFAHHPFHESVRQRARPRDFAGAFLNVMSAEDLVVFKVVFNRNRDWVDIEAVLEHEGERFDRAYVLDWLAELLGPEDRARQRFAELSGG